MRTARLSDALEQDAATILASPARRRVYELVVAVPGLSVSELARRLSLHWNSVALHVEVLRQAGLVASVRVGRRRVILPWALLHQAGTEGPGPLGEPACRRVAELICRLPHRQVWEIVELSGMSERAVYHHVKRLADAKLVATSKPGTYRGLRPTPRLLALVGLEGTRHDDPRAAAEKRGPPEL